ncbi:MAG: ABC-F family ATP-binding cassette domain-containing protein [Varibaculum sp.]|nr:ABC-F family ATP-binding cassette domain-containing protein [Varibaculum sp.]
MSFLTGIQDGAVTLGPREVLAGVTIGIEDGQRIGVLGSNGAGKTTLIRALAKTQELSTGSVRRTAGVRIALLDQRDLTDSETTVRQLVYGNRPEYEWKSDAGLRAIRSGLLPEIELSSRLGELSGGQRRRAHLAAQLSKPAEILFLDEPTNHLDIAGVNWLAKYLNNRFSGRGALVVVTHDRWFLDAVCEEIWEVLPAVDPGKGQAQTPGHVESYPGSYSAYVLARAERARVAELRAEKRENMLRKELAWLRRGAPARTSKPRFRIDAAETLIADVPPPRDSVALAKIVTARQGKRVVELVNVSAGYGGEAVLHDVTLRLSPGQRLGIVGGNGAGKSTLVRLLAGTLQPSAGYRLQGKTVIIGHLDQGSVNLKPVEHLRVMEAIREVADYIETADGQLSANQVARMLGFTGERAWTPVTNLSGGERRRLHLIRVLMSRPNLLILDEPTNDLDTDTLAALEDLLDSYPATLVIVSHDRYLLERTTDDMCVVTAAGEVRNLPGGIEQYLAEYAPKVEKTTGTGRGHQADDNPIAPRGQSRYKQQKQLAALQRKIDRRRVELDKLDEQMAKLSADPTAQNLQRLVDAAEERAVLTAEIDDLETEWLELSD